MSLLTYILIFSFIGGVVSLIGGIILLKNKKTAKGLEKYATPFAGGALLAAVFLDLLKEGVHFAEARYVLMLALAGIIIFFFAEGFLRWFHHHHEHDNNKSDPKSDPNKWLIVAGDTLHNAIDGVIIAAAFLISIPTGIVTTIAVAAHEIPQEIGNFGLLLSKGMRRLNVLLVNLASATSTIAFAVITYFVGSQDQIPIGILLGLSSGFLLYIAMSDIIPGIHAKKSQARFNIQALMLILGILVVGVVTTIAHDYMGDGHGHDHDNDHGSHEVHHEDDYYIDGHNNDYHDGHEHDSDH